MTTIAQFSPTTAAGARGRSFHFTVALLLGAAVGIGTLDFGARHAYSAVSHTLSELFYAPGGMVLFPVGAILLAGALFVWSKSLLRARLHFAGILIALGAAALVLTAIFPTDPSGTVELSWSAQVHRYTAAIMFTTVPVGGLLQLRAQSGLPSRASAHFVITSWAVGLSAVAALPAIFGRLKSVTLMSPFQDVFGSFSNASGLIERLQLLLVLTIIAVCTHSLNQGEGPTKPSHSPSISNNMKVTMSTNPETPTHKERRPAGRGALFGYAWAVFLLATPAWVLIGLFIAATGLAVIWIGVALWGVLLVATASFNGGFRAIASHILGTEILANYRPVLPGETKFDALRTYLTDPARWRDVAYLFFAITAGFVLGLASIIAFLIFPIGYWLSPWLLRTWAEATRLIIGPGDSAELQQRIGKLERSRSETVDASAAELRRIERDLHDGAQARLVAVAIDLGMAENAVETSPETAVALVAKARESTQQALSELRDLVRGIHPPVLADRGLAGGIEALALAHPAEVHVHDLTDHRFPAPVESAAYFAVAEALTNAAKHADASSVSITVTYQGRELAISIEDDGTGGAHFSSGGGLEGVRNRLDAFDGDVTLFSPSGGPTRVSLIIPCEVVSPVSRSTGAH